ncbi:MAG TPA: hypothetical protein PK036_13965 [Geobacteraceae bacterium]|nr:hypothetical protein [Geobacteraceae bacterium]
MTIRRRKFSDDSPIPSLLERDRLAMGRYRKTRERDPEERRLLMELALERIREAERTDYIPIGFRRRRLAG